AASILAGLFTQQQEVVGGPKTRVLQHLVGAAAVAPLQPWLHIPDLPQRNAETLGNGSVTALFGQQFVGRLLLGRNQRNTLFLQIAGTLGQCRPEQRGKQERRRDRAPLVNAVIGVAQGLANQLEGIAGVIFDGVVSVREQRREQVVLQQQIEGAFALAVEQQ